MGLDFNDFLDYQRNPFTRTTYYTSVVDESHVVSSQLGGYMVKLYHAPRETAPSSVMITIGGVPLQEVPSTVTPADMQFRVWYDEDGLGWVDFNANQDGETVLCSYEHYGTMHSKSSITSIFQVKELIYDSLTWQNAIERVSANVYKFRDDIYYIYVKYISGGYDINDILSNGDTWGVIQTNQVNNMEFESGAYINVGDTASYLDCNTEFFYGSNIGIKGIGLSGVLDATKSFYINALNITLINCWTSDRYISNTFNAFDHNVAIPGISSSFITCKVFDNICNNLVGFNNCDNLSNISIYNNETITAFTGIYAANNVNNLNIYDNTVSGTAAITFFTGTNISNVKITSNIVSTTSSCIIGSGKNIKNIYINSNTITCAPFNGITNSDNISEIVYNDNTIIGDVRYIYNSYNIENVLFYEETITGYVRGIDSCFSVSNIRSYSISSNSASNSSGIYNTIGVIDGNIAGISNSGAGSGYGYDTCRRCFGNTGTGNKTALFNTCYFSSDTSVSTAVGNGNG